MRTTVDLDEELLKEAMAVTGLTSVSAVCNEGLRRIVQCGRLVKESNGTTEEEAPHSSS
jgi:Arc/MetJ family transcription regulator